MFRYRSDPTIYHFRGVAVCSLFFCCAAFIGIQTCYALNASNVLVLYNNQSADGIQIADYYAQLHPGVQLLGLDGVLDQEQVSQDHYLDVIRPQVLDALTDNIQVIVTTKGMPLRIKNNVSNPGTYPGWRGAPFNVPILADWWECYSSLESELTRITQIDSAAMMGDQAYFISPPAFPFDTLHHASNPYYKADQAFDTQTEGYEGMRLTARLDGFTVDDVTAALNRAQNSYILSDGQFVIVDDDPDAPASDVDRMTQLSFDVLEPADQAMVYDMSRADIEAAPMPVIGYVSHGSHAAGSGYIDRLDFDLSNGAVFHTWESYNAYSFEEGNNHVGQGLIGEWLQAGGTAALGHVEEPGASTATVANEDILWDMLLQGYTFAEAAWAATPQLSYVNTVVGDPLMRFIPWIHGDLNLDGMVGLDDLGVILVKWNQATSGGCLAGDLDKNGFVGLDDLDLMLGNWNNCDSTAPALLLNIPEPAGIAAWFALGLWRVTRRVHRAGKTRGV